MAAWFRGLRAQLMIMVAIPLIVIAGVGATGYYALSILNNDIREIGESHLPQAIHIGGIAKGLQGVNGTFWEIYGAKGNADERQPLIERLQKFREQVDSELDMVKADLFDKKGQQVWQSIVSDWKKAKPIIVEAEQKFAIQTPEGNEAARVYLETTLKPVMSTLEDSVDVVTGEQVEAGTGKSWGAIDFTSRILTIMGFAIPITSIIITGFGIGLAWRLSSRLSTVVSQVSSSASNVGQASRTLSDASEKLASGANEAAASLEQTVASLDELSSMVRQNADNSKEAGALSQSARSSAEEGEGEVRHLIAAMGEISQSSKKIEEIITVIDDIAFQTNLLALNAAVEAARAGEQGKGFAVVAEAVRGLAQRSSEAAKDTYNLIRESAEKVARGREIADRSGDVLNKIVSNSKKAADLTVEIAMASQEQASGIAQISKVMNQLDQATQSNAASAEEAASTSQELFGESDNLRHQVIDLIEIVDGKQARLTSVEDEVETVAQRSSASTVRHLVPKPRGESKVEETIPFG